MIKFPSLKNGKKKVKKYVYTFGGINNKNTYREGELEDCTNISIDNLPYLCSGREYLSQNALAEDLIGGGDGVARIVTGDDGKRILYYRPEKKNSNWTSYPVEVTAGKKEIASAGGKVLLMPDKMVLDLTETYPMWKPVEKTITYDKSLILFYNGYMVFTTSENFNTFKAKFKVGDVVTFSGGYYYGNSVSESWAEKKLVIREISNAAQRKITFDPYCFGDANGRENTACVFKKSIDNLSHLCSFNDRVWGVTEDGKICGSKFQDPTNFEYFDLTSADSFTLEAGAGGAFTASCGTGSYALFFREDKIHRITGTKPSNYRHTVIKQNGVMSGSERSLTVIDDIVYYEGKKGIYAFDGAEAQLVSENLGEFEHSLGVAASYGDEYYISTKNESGDYILYRYSTRKGIWAGDGIKKYVSAVNFMGDMFFVDENNVIYKIQSQKSSQDFSATLRPFELDFAEKKGFLRLYIGYSLKSGYITCSVSYNDGPFQQVKKITDASKTVEEIRLSPNRGDNIKLSLYGTYDAVIKCIMREYHSHGGVI